MHPGAQVGRYVLHQQLGSGSHGQVWSAYLAESPGFRFALKLLRPGKSDAGQRLVHEARLLASLQRHPHDSLPLVYELFEPDATQIVLVMQLVQGQTLGQAQQQLDTEQKLLILRYLAAVLAHLHPLEVVHRDLKPDNVIIAEGFWSNPRPSTVKLVDFGIALSPQRTRITHINAPVGAMRYLAPEILMGPALWPWLGEAPDGPTRDIYAFGVLGWMLLTGRHPAGVESCQTPEQQQALRAFLLRCAQQQRIEDWPQGEVPPGWREALGRCLSLDPSRRPRDGRELVALLSSLSPARVPSPSIHSEPTDPLAFRQPAGAAARGQPPQASAPAPVPILLPAVAPAQAGAATGAGPRPGDALPGAAAWASPARVQPTPGTAQAQTNHGATPLPMRSGSSPSLVPPAALSLHGAPPQQAPPRPSRAGALGLAIGVTAAAALGLGVTAAVIWSEQGGKAPPRPGPQPGPTGSVGNRVSTTPTATPRPSPAAAPRPFGCAAGCCSAACCNTCQSVCLPGARCPSRSCQEALQPSETWSLRPLGGEQKGKTWMTHWSDGQVCLRRSTGGNEVCWPVRSLGGLPPGAGLPATTADLVTGGLDVSLRNARGEVVSAWKNQKRSNGLSAGVVCKGLDFKLERDAADQGNMIKLVLDEAP